MDPRGRTPLHLAVSLNRVSCATLLLQSNANPLAENRHKWSGGCGQMHGCEGAVAGSLLSLISRYNA